MDALSEAISVDGRPIFEQLIAVAAQGSLDAPIRGNLTSCCSSIWTSHFHCLQGRPLLLHTGATSFYVECVVSATMI